MHGVVVAGNVMVYLAPGTEGRCWSGWPPTSRPVGSSSASPPTVATTQEDLERDAVAAGLVPEHRFATWDLRPWRADSDFVVAILRSPET